MSTIIEVFLPRSTRTPAEHWTSSCSSTMFSTRRGSKDFRVSKSFARPYSIRRDERNPCANTLCVVGEGMSCCRGCFAGIASTCFPITSSPSARANAQKVLSWIPDFQHLHLPDYFSEGERRVRNRKYEQVCQQSRIVILSSESARADLLALYPQMSGRTAVLPFVPQVETGEALPTRADLESRYHIGGRFIHLPNQYMIHKNHALVVKQSDCLPNVGPHHRRVDGAPLGLSPSQVLRAIAGPYRGTRHRIVLSTARCRSIRRHDRVDEGVDLRRQSVPIRRLEYDRRRSEGSRQIHSALGYSGSPRTGSTALPLSSASTMSSRWPT